MFLDLSKVLNAPDTCMEFSFEKGPDVVENNGKEFFFEYPTEITGQLCNLGGSLKIECTFKATMKTTCDRCLKEANYPVSFSFCERLVKEGEHSDEGSFFEGSKVDFSEILIKNILMQLEMKYLCKPDCKGICPICGTDLNLHSCSCKQKSIDPRLEKLAELLK